MSLGGSKLRHFVIVTLAALTLSACGVIGERETERPLESFSAEELYNRAEFELETTGNPEGAARFFGEVERLYPYSEWARRAIVMQAFSYHRATDYDDIVRVLFGCCHLHLPVRCFIRPAHLGRKKHPAPDTIFRPPNNRAARLNLHLLMSDPRPNMDRSDRVPLAAHAVCPTHSCGQ